MFFSVKMRWYFCLVVESGVGEEAIEPNEGHQSAEASAQHLRRWEWRSSHQSLQGLGTVEWPDSCFLQRWVFITTRISLGQLSDVEENICNKYMLSYLEFWFWLQSLLQQDTLFVPLVSDVTRRLLATLPSGEIKQCSSLKVDSRLKSMSSWEGTLATLVASVLVFRSTLIWVSSKSETT